MKNLALALAATLISSAAHAVPVLWDSTAGGNDHYYEVVYTTETTDTWSEARTAATSSTHAGMSGYLASVTSAAEHSFLLDLISDDIDDGLRLFWLGGTDETTEGTWTWVDGPEDGDVFYTDAGGATGFTAWGTANGITQPNDESSLDGSTEDYLQLGFYKDNWNDQTGDVLGQAYIVEYSELPVVPLPASGLLLLGGLGAMFARRRKS